jgi:hypothetical protein
MNFKKPFFTALLLLSLVSPSAWAATAEAKPASTPTPAPTAVLPPSNVRPGLSLGVGWPYAGLKDYFNDDFGAEIRFSTGDGINVYAARGYWSFERFRDFSLITGLEGGYITFTNALNADNTLRVSGDGYEFAPFLGAEYFLAKSLSFQLDFSMPVIFVQSRGEGLGDLQWVFNGGLYVYPF